MKKINGEATTSEVYTYSEDKSIAFVEGKRYPLFAVNKILSAREWLPLMGITLPSTMIPSEFLALIKRGVSIEEAVELVNERIVDSIAQEIAREERYSLRNERKRPWSVRTRRPFRGVIDKSIPTLKEELELAERVVKELGLPWKGSNRGRPPVYDQVKLVAAILVKGMRSFAGLAADLREIDYVMTVDGGDSKPCPSELHHVFQRIPREWLEIALARLDELSVEEFSKFENLDTFVVDGSALSCETLIEREVVMKTRLIRESFHYLALIRTATNTIRGIKVHSNKIADFIPLLPQGSTVIADSEFDAEKNYRDAKEAHVDLQVKQKKGAVRKSMRKAAREGFDEKKYRRRKLGERPFGNIEARRSKCYYKTPESRLKGAILIACNHNIIAYFKNKAWCGLFIRL